MEQTTRKRRWVVWRVCAPELAIFATNIVSKYFWVLHDLVQEFGIGKDDFIDLLQLLFVSKIIQQSAIGEGQRAKVLAASVVRRKLQLIVSFASSATFYLFTEYLAYCLNVVTTFWK